MRTFDGSVGCCVSWVGLLVVGWVFGLLDGWVVVGWASQDGRVGIPSLAALGKHWVLEACCVVEE